MFGSGLEIGMIQDITVKAHPGTLRGLRLAAFGPGAAVPGTTTLRRTCAYQTGSGPIRLTGPTMSDSAAFVGPNEVMRDRCKSTSNPRLIYRGLGWVNKVCLVTGLSHTTNRIDVSTREV